jgi:hypothetical protein
VKAKGTVAWIAGRRASRPPIAADERPRSRKKTGRKGSVTPIAAK